MALTKLQHTINTPVTITETNTIGPTSNTAFRNNADLPFPAARSNGVPNSNTINVTNNANTIYVDPVNGNDANTGTTINTDAVKTIGRAWALVTGTRQNIHIEVFGGAVGTAWTLSQNWSAVANTANVLRIQCAAGQTGTITTTAYDADGPFNASAIRAINGINVIHIYDSAFPAIDYAISLVNTAGTLDIKWCSFDANIPSTGTGIKTGFLVKFIVAAATVATCQYNVFKLSTSGGMTFAVNAGASIVVDNNIYDGRGAIPLPNNAAVQVSNQAITVSVLMRHNTIYNQACGLYRVINGLITYTVHSNIYASVGMPAASPLSTSLTVITNSLINASTTVESDVSSATNLLQRNPLFLDQVNGDYRLRHKGLVASSGRNYKSTSPAVGLGLTGTDAGAYLRTYVTGAETSVDFEMIEGTAWAVEGQLVRVNFQGFENILGDFSCTWDGEKWELNFTFSRDYFQGFDQTAKFIRAYKSRTLIRYYPAGNDGLWGTAGIAITITSSTVIDTGSNIPPRIMPDNTVLAGSDQAIPDFYNGWIMRIQWTDGGSKTGYFEIVSHTETAWTLLYVRGDSNLLSGTAFTANIIYLPVQLDMSSLEIAVPYVSTCDSKPQTWHSPQGDVTSVGYQTEEPHYQSFKLKQTRELPL